MGQAQLKEHRRHMRHYSVKGDLPGDIVDVTTEEELAVKVVDVSRDGLGLLSDANLNEGQVLKLRLPNKEINFVVVYSIPDLINHGKFRCGLQRYGSSENLVGVFVQNGCLEN